MSASPLMAHPDLFTPPNVRTLQQLALLVFLEGVVVCATFLWGYYWTFFAGALAASFGLHCRRHFHAFPSLYGATVLALPHFVALQWGVILCALISCAAGVSYYICSFSCDLADTTAFAARVGQMASVAQCFTCCLLWYMMLVAVKHVPSNGLIDRRQPPSLGDAAPFPLLVVGMNAMVLLPTSAPLGPPRPQVVQQLANVEPNNNGCYTYVSPGAGYQRRREEEGGSADVVPLT